MKQERIPLTEVELEVVEAIEPLTYQVLVRPIEAAAQTEGGILLTRETQKNEELLNIIGRVLALGPLCFNHPKYDGTKPYDVGDFVLYGQYSGRSILLSDDRRVIILNDDQIVCKVRNPKAILRLR